MTDAELRRWLTALYRTGAATTGTTHAVFPSMSATLLAEHEHRWGRNGCARYGGWDGNHHPDGPVSMTRLIGVDLPVDAYERSSQLTLMASGSPSGGPTT